MSTPGGDGGGQQTGPLGERPARLGVHRDGLHLDRGVVGDSFENGFGLVAEGAVGLGYKRHPSHERVPRAIPAVIWCKRVGIGTYIV